MTPKGIADQSIHGRNLPCLVLVRSHMMPIKTSLMPSPNLATRNNNPTAAGLNPKTSV